MSKDNQKADVSSSQNQPASAGGTPNKEKKETPQNDKGHRPDVSKGVDPSVSSNSTVRNPEADLQDKNIVGQD